MAETLREHLPTVKENEPLAPYTTFKVGGSARYFFVARSVNDILQASRAAADCGMPYFIFAGGSNILVSDKGFDGLVILNAIMGVAYEVRDGRAIVTAGAGESWDELVARCVSQGWSGIECLSGIPGTVGAAPVQNIGAYGQSVGEVIASIEAVDFGISPLGGGTPPPSGEIVTFSNAQCQFGYRTSIFKKTRGRYSITQVTLALNTGGAPLIAYHDLKQYFAPRESDLALTLPFPERRGVGGEGLPSLAQVRQAVIEIRAKKGYVIMPEYECYKTAGSFFMNPIIGRDEFEKLRKLVRECPDPWYWPLADGRVKVSAACLLQSAGFSKGYRRGEVGISPKHSLSLVNFGSASASDVVALAREIKSAVKDKFGIILTEEVQLVGF